MTTMSDDEDMKMTSLISSSTHANVDMIWRRSGAEEEIECHCPASHTRYDKSSIVKMAATCERSSLMTAGFKSLISLPCELLLSGSTKLDAFEAYELRSLT
ncbi:unnamed protein product [Urochloa humidicola]